MPSNRASRAELHFEPMIRYYQHLGEAIILSGRLHHYLDSYQSLNVNMLADLVLVAIMYPVQLNSSCRRSSSVFYPGTVPTDACTHVG